MHDHTGNHQHHQHCHSHSHQIKDKRTLGFALAITFGFMLVEISTGFLANSLALLSDGLHMFGDVVSLGLNWGALWLAARPRTSRYTYGFLRAEILGGFLSAMGLWVSCGFIIYEGAQRILNPQPFQAPAVIGVAILGLIVNLIVLRLIHRTLHDTKSNSGEKKNSLSLRAAYLHVIADTLGSVGALGAGIIYLITGWSYADSVASFLIAGMILFGSWQLVKESFSILMESSPGHIDGEAVKMTLRKLPGIREVHDLHIWSLSSSQLALSAHLVTDAQEGTFATFYSKTILQATQLLRDHFGIQHTTLQIEHPEGLKDCTGCD